MSFLNACQTPLWRTLATHNRAATPISASEATSYPHSLAEELLFQSLVHIAHFPRRLCVRERERERDTRFYLKRASSSRKIISSEFYFILFFLS